MVETTSRMASSSSTTKMFSPSTMVGSSSHYTGQHMRNGEACSVIKQHVSVMVKLFSQVPGLWETPLAKIYFRVVAVLDGRRHHVLENQGLLAIAFFEATALIVLLVLFLLFRRDHPSSYFRLWLAGWVCLTLSSSCEVGLVLRENPGLWLAALVARVAAVMVFLLSVMQYTAGSTKHY